MSSSVAQAAAAWNTPVAQFYSVSKQFFKIYGYSQSFGQADHNHVVELIKDHLNYPKYEVSFEGY
jgi:hypothetical protein